MFSSIFNKIAIGIVSILTAFGIYQSPDIEKIIEKPIEQEFLGSQLAVGGETYYLSGSGITSTQTTIDLTKFGYTKPDGTYQKFTMTNFGDLGCGTVEPANTKGKQEFVSFTGITQNSDNTAQLTGISRGLERFSPWSASTTLRTSHTGGSRFVISNSPPCFYENYVTINNAETIESIKTFSSTTPPRYDTAITVSGNQFVPFNQLNDVVVGSVGTSTEDALGLVRLATSSQQALSTASSTTGAPLVLISRNADATYDGSKSNQVVVTGSSNTIDANYIATSSAYTWSGSHSFTASTTFSGATTTMNGLNIRASTTTPIVLNGQSYAFPQTQTGSSTVSTTNGSGNIIWDYQGWDLLGEYASTSASATLNANGFNTRRDLRVILYSLGQTDANATLRFNGDTASNYGYKEISDISILAISSGVSSIELNNVSTSSPNYWIFDITNLSGQRKLISSKATYSSSGTVSPKVINLSGVWNNTSAQITAIEFKMSSGTFNANSFIRVYGSKD